MTLEEQILDLQDQRDSELTNVTRQFSRLKKETRNALSPARHIRKHAFASLAIALAAGFLIAPTLRGKPAPSAARRPPLRRLLQTLLKFFPRWRSKVEPFLHSRKTPPAEPSPPAQTAPSGASPLGSILNHLMQEFNLPALIVPFIAQLVAHLFPSNKNSNHAHQNPGAPSQYEELPH